MRKLSKKTTNNITNLLNKYNKKREYQLSIEGFVSNVDRYCKAIKQGRMICNTENYGNIGNFDMKFIEVSSSGNNYSILNFYQLFDILGYRESKNNQGYYRIMFGNMDMVFESNYRNIQKFYNLGLISKKACEVLAQKIPHKI